MRSSSVTSLFSLAPPPNQSLPSAVAKELDALAEAARQADVNFINDAANQAFSRCLEYKKQVRRQWNSPGYLLINPFDSTEYT